jgi:hypothetical protein
LHHFVRKVRENFFKKSGDPKSHLNFRFRLIDGLTGEKSVYKKRGEQEPEVGAPQVPYTLRQASVADPDMVLGLLDPDPDLLVRGTGPDPFPDSCIIKQK